jgi:hypothetical protein
LLLHQKLVLLFEFLQPAKPFLAVFKLPVGLLVQEEPSYSSVAADLPVEPGGAVNPPKPNAAV